MVNSSKPTFRRTNLNLFWLARSVFRASHPTIWIHLGWCRFFQTVTIVSHFYRNVEPMSHFVLFLRSYTSAAHHFHFLRVVSLSMVSLSNICLCSWHLILPTFSQNVLIYPFHSFLSIYLMVSGFRSLFIVEFLSGTAASHFTTVCWSSCWIAFFFFPWFSHCSRRRPVIVFSQLSQFCLISNIFDITITSTSHAVVAFWRDVHMWRCDHRYCILWGHSWTILLRL